MEQPEVLLGDLLAQNLKKKTGDTLTIQGRNFTVAGIFHGGTALEAGAVIMPLDQMQIISEHAGKSDRVPCAASARARRAKPRINTSSRSQQEIEAAVARNPRRCLPRNARQ